MTSEHEVQFRKTRRQREVLDVANQNTHSLAYGGSRSGKTFILVRNAFVRAIKRPSKHLIVRYRFNHAKQSLCYETIPEVLRLCFPGVPIVLNKSDWFYTVPTAKGGTSTVWIGGTDEAERVEKILGNEYSTIYANECSQIPFDSIFTLWTRLAETSGLPLRFYYDCNPPGKRHWSHSLFFDHKLPDGGGPFDMTHGKIQVNPKHNVENLSPEYIKILESLPPRQRKRFLDGLYLDDVEGALWTDLAIERAKSLVPAQFRKTVIAVDPSVSNNPGSDECGIGVASLDVEGQGVVRKDLSGKMSTRAWASRVVSAYHAYEANEVVAEVNQGGDLVEQAIHNIDPYVKVVKVRAAVGKQARAEPVSMLYEQGKVCHTEDMPELESELTEWVPEKTQASPNRLDWLVWALSHLMIGKGQPRLHFGVAG